MPAPGATSRLAVRPRYRRRSCRCEVAEAQATAAILPTAITAAAAIDPNRRQAIPESPKMLPSKTNDNGVIRPSLPNRRATIQTLRPMVKRTACRTGFPIRRFRFPAFRLRRDRKPALRRCQSHTEYPNRGAAAIRLPAAPPTIRHSEFRTHRSASYGNRSSLPGAGPMWTRASPRADPNAGPGD